MPNRVVDPEQERAKRAIRQRIGRLRRRLDHRAFRLRDEGRRLASWRTYVTRYTTGATAAAFGLGLALAAGLSGRRLLRWTALRLMRQGFREVGHGVWGEVVRMWRDSAPDRSKAPGSEVHDA
ncbi:MAG: hypothetical protein JW818_16835 [Pirellulales bacterium]|nr:hypothetical protein [Pirellulales bacterium]